LDSGAGTIHVRAIFDNADGALVPGLYARVAVDADAPHQTVLVDERAISTDQAKKFVLVVDDQHHAQYREVVPGNDHDGFREIDSGLKPDERIVVNGTQRIHPGDAITVKMVPMSGEQTSE
ncbi:MAG: efflux transporter periplasmic adaptor subunit, partial [Rhodanobacter sp.]